MGGSDPPDTKAVFFESVSNPTLEVVDIDAFRNLAHAQGALVLIDNVFATPVIQTPLRRARMW